MKNNLGQHIFLGVKIEDYTKNFRPQEVKMTNKVLREKSHCVAFRFNKSKISKVKSKLTTVVTVS